MKKDKKWAQKEVDRYLSYEGVGAAINALVFAKIVISQLDEPEVLSKEEEQTPETVADVMVDFSKSLERLKEVLGMELKD